jgi:hypothetical protein
MMVVQVIGTCQLRKLDLLQFSSCMDSPELNQKIVAQIEAISEGKDVEAVKRLVLEADPAILVS